MEKQRTIQEAIGEMLLEILLWIGLTFFVCVSCLIVDPKIELNYVMFKLTEFYYVYVQGFLA